MSRLCTCTSLPNIWCEACQRFPQHPGSHPERAAEAMRLASTGQHEDNEATLRLVRALRADPDCERLMNVIAALATATQGTPQHFAWNKLWWVLYTPQATKVRVPKPRRKKP